MTCSQFEQEQITKLQSLLTAYLDAILTLLTGAKEYTIDTGQGRQTVKREDIDKLQENYGLIWQQYDALNARCGNGGSIQQVPWGAIPWNNLQ
jgi:hypothetical protein